MTIIWFVVERVDDDEPVDEMVWALSRPWNDTLLSLLLVREFDKERPVAAAVRRRNFWANGDVSFVDDFRVGLLLIDGTVFFPLLYDVSFGGSFSKLLVDNGRSGERET